MTFPSGNISKVTGTNQGFEQVLPILVVLSVINLYFFILFALQVGKKIEMCFMGPTTAFMVLNNQRGWLDGKDVDAS